MFNLMSNFLGSHHIDANFFIYDVTKGVKHSLV